MGACILFLSIVFFLTVGIIFRAFIYEEDEMIYRKMPYRPEASVVTNIILGLIGLVICLGLIKIIKNTER